MMKLWFYVFSVFLSGFIIPSSLGNTEIITLHSSIPVQDFPSEIISTDHESFGSVFLNSVPGYNERVFHVQHSQITYLDDCRNHTACPADVWFTLDMTEPRTSTIIPWSLTVRLSWAASDAVEYDIQVFESPRGLNPTHRHVRIRPFKIGIPGNHVYIPLKALHFGSTPDLNYPKSGDTGIRFHIKIEILLWHVVPISMLAPGAVILCLAAFNYFVASPLVISFLEQVGMGDLKKTKDL